MSGLRIPEGKPGFHEIRRDLGVFSGYEVVLYGSWINGFFGPRSDIDVALISREVDVEKNKALWRDVLGKVPDRYDVRVFELLPLRIQADIVENHEIVFGDPLELSEYFYSVRRRWKDVRHRLERESPLPVRERVKRLRRNFTR